MHPRTAQQLEKLKEKSVGKLTMEELRFLIAHQEAHHILVPVALTVLQENPLIEGEKYPGDLLRSLCDVPKAYWKSVPQNAEIFSEVLDALSNKLHNLGGGVLKWNEEALELGRAALT